MTIDTVISKIIPVIGALFIVWGLGYLIYSSVWMSIGDWTKVGLWFFAGILCVGGGFSLQNKMKYYADIIISIGVLLFYSALIYGSRTAEAATALIPEQATLIVALLFTGWIAYFASMRKSHVILALGMLAAYVTPFFIGQVDSWQYAISFNSYLLYFFAVNVMIYFLGKEISLHRLIPVNGLGLLVGSTTIHYLTTSSSTDSFFSGSIFSAILFLGIVSFYVTAIVRSSNSFSDTENKFLFLGYLSPLVWFALNLSRLGIDNVVLKTSFYAVLVAVYFGWWYYLRALVSRNNHISLYIGGMLAIVFGVFTAFPTFSEYTGIFVAYIGIIFLALYYFQEKLLGRALSFIIFSALGAVITLYHLYFPSAIAHSAHITTIMAIIGLLPTCSIILLKNDAVIVSSKEKFEGLKVLTDMIPVVALCIIGFLLIKETFSSGIPPLFMLFTVPGLLFVLYAFFRKNNTPQSQQTALWIGLVGSSIGYFSTFFTLIGRIYPAPTNTHILQTKESLIGIITTITFFLALYISRRLQKMTQENRPSFFLVIFSYASLLLIVNHEILATFNSLFSVSELQNMDGTRAIATTFWWAILASFMLYTGVKNGPGHRSEKLLGLVFMGITVFKIIVYDLRTFDTQLKTIVLIIVGGILLWLSYYLNAKGYLKADESNKENIPSDSMIAKEKVETPISLEKKIENIDTSGLSSVIFAFNSGRKIEIKTKNLLKIAKMVIDNNGKTLFTPGELQTAYAYIAKNYKSQVSETDYKKITTVLEEFVQDGGEIVLK